jgi:aminomethyltransferase
MEPLKTPLYEKHVENNGHIVDFSGWALPVEYSSILKEAKAVRTTCGLFDASHMGEIYIKGKDALSFLQSLTPNDISLTKKGQLQYNLFLNDKGGIVDDLMIYNLGESFLCVVNASNTDKVYNWLMLKIRDGKYTKENKSDLEVINESDNTSLLSLQGPKAVFIMEKIFGSEVKNLKYMRFTQLLFKDKKTIVSRSGYTGEDGFEIYCDNVLAPHIWDLILKYGKEEGLVLSGLGARDVLRIEAGYPLYGHEMRLLWAGLLS